MCNLWNFYEEIVFIYCNDIVFFFFFLINCLKKFETKDIVLLHRRNIQIQSLIIFLQLEFILFKNDIENCIIKYEIQPQIYRIYLLEFLKLNNR